MGLQGQIMGAYRIAISILRICNDECVMLYICWYITFIHLMQAKPINIKHSKNYAPCYVMSWFDVIVPVLVNSSPPSVADMRQRVRSALVQIMAWRLFGTKPLSKYLNLCCVTVHRNRHQRNVNQNTKLFIHEHAAENIVYEMAAVCPEKDELSHTEENR